MGLLHECVTGLAASLRRRSIFVLLIFLWRGVGVMSALRLPALRLRKIPMFSGKRRGVSSNAGVELALFDDQQRPSYLTRYRFITRPFNVNDFAFYCRYRANFRKYDAGTNSFKCGLRWFAMNFLADDSMQKVFFAC